VTVVDDGSAAVLKLVGERQGLTLVYFSAQHKHFLWDTLGTFSTCVGHNSSQTGH